VKKISRRVFMFLGVVTLAVPAWLTWLWGQITKPVRTLLPSKTSKSIEWVPVDHIVNRTWNDGTVTRMKERWLVGVNQGRGFPLFEEAQFKGAEKHDGLEGLLYAWECPKCRWGFKESWRRYGREAPVVCRACGIECEWRFIDPCHHDNTLSSVERREAIEKEVEDAIKNGCFVPGHSKPFTEQEKEFLVETLLLCKRYDEQKRRGSLLTALSETEQEAMRVEIRKSFES